MLQCKFEGCDRQRVAKELCQTHYRQQQRGVALKPISIPTKYCSIEGCNRPYNGRGYCIMHLTRLRKHGDVGGPEPLKIRGNWSNSNGYLVRNNKSQHRLVMEEILGRPLRQDEQVHHKNGVRSDNRPENLELWLVHQPAGQRVEDLVIWAREILKRYDSN